MRTLNIISITVRGAQHLRGVSVASRFEGASSP